MFGGGGGGLFALPCSLPSTLRCLVPLLVSSCPLAQKSEKCPVLYAQFEEHSTYWTFFWCESTLDYRAKKSKKCLVFKAQFEKKQIDFLPDILVLRKIGKTVKKVLDIIGAI